ncbi:winged helix-turn-helix transcriptional regulator [Fervidibacillus albus]|uniref:Helix-turn-helix transcriptional regulator n=1 Tax=Fervidibacillus albus TaxID=2980026 RepID=A0A9E8RV28_9BACI|nr:helix-turn-helix domain-containing protein [Fervidibacillus albus]WAA08879.1 helix-turn-helix transcriptional regulator [Fervidibacillus albus]
MENKALKEEIVNTKFCPMEFAMNKSAGKWKLVILWHIYENEEIRFNELMRSINKITHKMLSYQLKELVNDGFVHKEMYKQIPPKVEYSLTDHGKTLVPIMKMLFEWGSKHRKTN